VGDILTGTTDYAAIRTRLGVTTDDLPDADITTIGLLPVAEALVEQLVTDWATIMAGVGPNKVFLQAATLALCGALAVRKLELQRGQSFRQGDYAESETKVDWNTLRDELLLESRDYLLKISTHIPTTRRKLFGASGPTSSAAAWPVVVQQWFGKLTPHVMMWLSDGGQRRYDWEQQP
jgi:hypothetical protein